MKNFQAEEQKMVQDEQIYLLLNFKFLQLIPIFHHIEYLKIEKVDKFIEIILEGV